MIDDMLDDDEDENELLDAMPVRDLEDTLNDDDWQEIDTTTSTEYPNGWNSVES